MALFLSYLGLLCAEQSIVSTLDSALRAYNSGNFAFMKDLFSSTESMYIDNAKYQSQYLDYLTKLGEYDRIIGMKSKISERNRELLDAACRYASILKTGSVKEIGKLYDVSPNSYRVAISAAESDLNEGDYASFTEHIGRAVKLVPEAPKNSELMARYSFAIGDYERGLQYLYRAQERDAADGFRAVWEAFGAAKSRAETDQDRFAELKAVFRSLVLRKNRDAYVPSIYTRLNTEVLLYISSFGCDRNLQGVHFFADKCYEIDKSEISKFNKIKAMVIDGQPLDAARALLKAHAGELSANRHKVLQSLISLAEKSRRERQARRKMEMDERARREEWARQQRQAQQQAPSSRAGEDFLGHYKILGLDRSASVADVKKAFKRKYRRADSHSKDLKQASDYKKRLTKAESVLSNKKERSLYDSGVDPEQPHQQQRGHERHGDAEFNEVFEALFRSHGAGGRHFYNGGYGQQQFYFAW